MTALRYRFALLAARRVYTAADLPLGTVSFLFKQALEYDSAGQIVRQRWQHRGGSEMSQDYGYDSVGRLVNWVDNAMTTSYAYDSVGNRMNSTGPGGGSTYFYPGFAQGNRLDSVVTPQGLMIHTTSYTYDANGSAIARSNVDRPLPSGPPIAQPLETFQYSYRDLLWRYTRNGAQNDWRYRYSASGEREQKRLYPIDTNEHVTSHGVSARPTASIVG